MRVGFRRFAEPLGQAGEDRVLSDDRRAVLEHEHRNRVRTCGIEERPALGALDRHLMDDVVDAELRQPLADAARRRAPLGLEELEHQPSPPATSLSDSKRRCSVPHTTSQSA